MVTVSPTSGAESGISIPDISAPSPTGLGRATRAIKATLPGRSVGN
jgi:hypothetical protein